MMSSPESKIHTTDVIATLSLDTLRLLLQVLVPTVGRVYFPLQVDIFGL